MIQAVKASKPNDLEACLFSTPYELQEKRLEMSQTLLESTHPLCRMCTKQKAAVKIHPRCAFPAIKKNFGQFPNGNLSPHSYFTVSMNGVLDSDQIRWGPRIRIGK